MRSSPPAERASVTCRSAPLQCWKRSRTGLEPPRISLAAALRVPRILGRICDRSTPDFCKRSESMNLAAGRAHDVLRANSANEQGIRDERPMTAPRQGFRAHQDNLILLRQSDRFFE